VRFLLPSMLQTRSVFECRDWPGVNAVLEYKQVSCPSPKLEENV
jgi:hypothetical protein